jgi:hypothetical protein
MAPAFSWYVHVAQGNNLRTAPLLPMALTRRAAHEAMFAPDHLTPLQALLFGHFRACGGPDAIARELLAHVGKSFALDAEWLRLFEKLLAAPGLAPDQVRPLVDYVAFRRFRCERRDRFSVAVHSVPSLLKHMAEWHAALRGAAFRRSAGVGLDERWASRIGPSPFEGRWEQGRYVVTELRSFADLYEEGRRMHHCVATYALAAARGTVSIWSLRLGAEEREVGRVTIRVTVHKREVVEARRFANARIEAHERAILERWAAQRGLSVAAGL